ncbi:uncharacterized protein AMSG_12416 [Thecamonas trahens ATCC 50062]|uniref:Uncharacterized protein n=1 Tax=Thecamonas trahens ATCC 50062 TaxID=461836 RepID=A0A0L0DTS4_THETB|nr:hypothetical protein AMSG_12416 [Thecamonas trahens ATCC 50062]KNC55734.1 hypothetical protein AMSG_12416 [Thecamonas trahens ATCC 50062]|eukprot:XP_013752914.1 hypothetical protein AMSG_12416 [Thecamonas trahens ATCC 50062]
MGRAGAGSGDAQLTSATDLPSPGLAEIPAAIATLVNIAGGGKPSASAPHHRPLHRAPPLPHLLLPLVASLWPRSRAFPSVAPSIHPHIRRPSQIHTPKDSCTCRN